MLPKHSSQKGEQQQHHPPMNRVRRTLIVVLLLVWVATVGAAITADAVIDTFQRNDTELPLAPVAICGTVLNGVACFWTMLMGRLSSRHFRFFQPFQGGTAFSALQAAGYIGVIVVQVAKLVFLEYLASGSADRAVFRYGVLTSLGAFSGAAQTLLLYSLTLFKASSSAAPTKSEGRSGSDSGATEANAEPAVAAGGTVGYRELSVVLLLAVIMVGMSSAAEYYPSLCLPDTIIQLCLTLASILLFLRHVLAAKAPDASLWVPCLRTPLCGVLQLVGHFAVLLSFCGNAVLLNYDQEPTPSLHLITGLLSTLGTICLLLFVYLLPTSSTNASTTESAEASTASSGQKRVTGILYGPLLLTVLSILIVACVFLLSFVQSVAPAAAGASASPAFRVLQQLLATLLFFLPPSTHLQGRLTFGRAFHVWGPFSGSVEFVTLQSVSWGFFAFGIFFAILHATETGHTNFVLLQTSALICSQLLVHASLVAFRENMARLNARGSRAGAANSAGPDGSAASPDSLVNIVNGEFLLGVVLQLSAIVISVLCDVTTVFELRHFPREAALTCAFVMSVLAPLAVQFSLHDRITITDLVTHPRRFAYVELQRLGTFTSLGAIIWRVATSASQEGEAAQSVPPGLFASTRRCLYESIPFVCVLLFDVFETQAIFRQRERTRRVDDAAKELGELLIEHVKGGELERAQQLVHLIRGKALPAALKGRLGVSAVDPLVSPDDAEAKLESNAKYIAARDMTTLMALASTLAIGGAANVSSPSNGPFFSLALATVGMLILSLSCVSLHCIFGTQLHRSEYTVFMPFKGGKYFVFMQAVGWGSYTACCLFYVTCFIVGHGSATTFSLMCVSGGLAQLALLRSIPLFKCGRDESSTFIKKNAEGILSLLVVFGVLLYSNVYYGVSKGNNATDTGVLVSIVLSSLSAVFAVPIALLSLQKQAQDQNITAATVLDEGYDSDMDEIDTGMARLSSSIVPDESFGRGESEWLQQQQQHGNGAGSEMASPTSTASVMSPTTFAARMYQRRGLARYTLITMYSLSTLLAVIIVVFLLLVVILTVCSYSLDVAWSYESLASVIQALILFFIVFTALPMFLAPIIRWSRTVRNVHSAICCYSLYSIPTITVVGGLFPGIVIRTRGGYLFSFCICMMACLSTLPKVHLMCYIFNVICFAWFSYYHLHYCLYEKKDPFLPVEFVGDMLCTIFWMWYGRRFRGRPELTGELQNSRASRFFQDYLFEGLAHYFSLKIIVSDFEVLPMEREIYAALPEDTIEKRVDLSNPDNQYMFSFHPHGVFPGSSICIPKTRLWERKLGRNDKHFVSTHCADVVFSVPLMREFPLALGAMSVSRRGIQNSIRSGNSPLIVTGGQSEMILTRFSDTEMHLVCHHLGFIKLALKNKIPLVPVISFNESNILENVHMLKLQKWFLKRVAFTFPLVPYGRWHLPLPTTRPLCLVIGQPLRPLPGHEDPDVPSNVEEMRLRYFEHLEVLFYKHRAEAGYPNMVLVFHNGVDDPGVVSEPPASVAEARAASSDSKEAQKPSAVPTSGPGSPLSAARRALSGFAESYMPPAASANTSTTAQAIQKKQA